MRHQVIGTSDHRVIARARISRPLAILIIALCLALMGGGMFIGCAKRVGTPAGQQAKPITVWENIHEANAQIALYNNGLAKSVIAANELGALEESYTRKITDAQYNIAGWQKELTPLLRDQATAKANAPRVKELIGKIGDSATALIQSGNVGIKNTSTAAEVTVAINGLKRTSQSLLDLLKTAGVL